ncbi:MAG: T9SS type A sorting domain-containing protein, partial [Chitinophagales bacterium]
FTLPGEYEVCLTAGNIAGTNSACKFISIATDIHPLDPDAVQIFPNPASDYLQIQFAKGSGNKKVSLFDATGQLVFASTTGETDYIIDVTPLANGIYQLEVIMDKRKGIYNLLVNK